MEVAKSVLLYVEIPGLMSEILRPALHSLARNQGGCAAREGGSVKVDWTGWPVGTQTRAMHHAGRAVRSYVLF